MSHRSVTMSSESNNFKAPETPLVSSRTKPHGITMLTPSSSSPRAPSHPQYIKATSSIKRINKRVRNASYKNAIQEASSSQTDEEYPSNNEGDDEEGNKLSSQSTLTNDYGLVITGVGKSDKPPYSYATLIGMSILTSQSKKLTLAQIYSWISDNFMYYKKGDVGWQNSIRHNLSLNKAFTKTEKSKDGKGHYWQIEPGMEHQFLKSKNTKKTSSSMSSAKKASSKRTTKRLDSSTKQSKSTYINAYQQLTPSNSMIQQEDDEDEADKDITTDPATDTFSSDNDSEPYVVLKNEDRLPHQLFQNLNHDILGDHFKSLEPQIASKQPTKIRLSQLEPALLVLPSSNKHGVKRLYEETDDEEDEDDPSDDEEYHTAKKSSTYKKRSNDKSKITVTKTPRSSSNKLLYNIPQLEAPASSWSASARGDSIIFNNSLSDSHIDADKLSTSAGPFTSSFSSNLNFDLSPIRRSDTGPILEPLTPGATNSNSQFTAANTPNRMKTPSSASIMRKIWNSPSYLDDFYTSPSHIKGNSGFPTPNVNATGAANATSSLAEDSVTSTPNFRGHPLHRNFNIGASAAALAAATYNGSPKRSSRLSSGRLKNSPHCLESSIIGNISTSYNDFFGVDICSVVKRAVESAVEKPGSEGSSKKDKHSKKR